MASLVNSELLEDLRSNANDANQNTETRKRHSKSSGVKKEGDAKTSHENTSPSAEYTSEQLHHVQR